MALQPVDYATYAALRDLDLSHPDVDATAPPPDGTDTWVLGHASSWARWSNTTDDVAAITAHSPDEFESLEPLTTSVVVLTTNQAADSPAGARIWGAFHHDDDITVADSVRRTYERTGPIPAPYLTDIFKLLPAPTTELDSQIEQERDQNRDHVGRCAQILQQELSLCVDGSDGTTPTLVAVGGAAYTWLSGRDWNTGKPIVDQRIADTVNEVLGEGANRRVEWVPHFNPGVATHDQRATALAAILARANL